MRGIFNVAGGIRYHARGWRYADTRWRPFREELGEWLAAWQPGGAKLVIVGPSGGYCLKPEWLAGFAEIACLDPDPLARRAFARRLPPAVRLSWSAEDCLRARQPLLQLKRLSAFLALHPGAPVLFSNFLGQLTLLLQEYRLNAAQCLPVWKSQLVRKTLAGRSWASFHDRLSGRLRPRLARPYLAETRLDDDELIRRFYPAPTGTVELGDHDTQGFFPAESPHAYFCWDLTPKWAHLIEATHSS